MFWNPLDFVGTTEVPTSYLDPTEMHRLGTEVGRIAVQQGVPITGDGQPITGREVGDDRVDLSKTPDGLCAALAVQEHVAKMVTSPEDTCIRRKSWNFCEVTSGPITDPSEAFDNVRKDGDFSKLGFNDSIILRIILDVQKGEGEEHSSTPAGKMSMLGSRLSTPRRENRGIWMLASIFQDAHLATQRSQEPKYLPPVMGGTGVTALFDNPNNVYSYVLTYKGGAYRRIYATAVAEMRDYLYRLERGVQSAPILCPRLREKQEYFWGTWKEKLFVPKSADLKSLDFKPPDPLYERTGGQNRYQNFENRLIRTRHLVTKSRAEVEWMHTQRLQHIFLSLFPDMKTFDMLDKDRSMSLRARYDYALSANTALQNLLRREAHESDAQKMMGDKAFHTLTVGKLDFTPEDALWVYLNGQGENYSLRDVHLSEDIFVRGEVSAEETFKVGGIPLRPYMTGGTKLYQTRTKVGLYQINMGMEEWAETLTAELIKRRASLGRPLLPVETGPIFDKRPEWVNDDSGLIARCHREVSDTSIGHQVVLVSADRRLANQMAETCNVSVHRIDPYDFVRVAVESGIELSETTNGDFLHKYGVPNRFVYIDTGSVLAAASKCEVEQKVPLRRTVIRTGWDGEHRFTQISLSKLEVRANLRKETHRPITRPKVWRSGSRPHESSYSSHSSWKSSYRTCRSEKSWRSSLKTIPNTRSPNLRIPGTYPSSQKEGGK